MSDLRDLYQEVILDHSKRPRNFRVPTGRAKHASGNNPLCGDQLTVYLRIEAGVVTEVTFQGSGCAISTASASLMTEALVGRPVEEIAPLHQQVHALLTGTATTRAGELGKLEVLAGVSEFPVRVKCATLAWHTLMAALQGASAAVSTE